MIAKIKGASAPDQWIIRGNHHDGWVFGAWGPLAGNVALMAEAKAIGGLLKQGWRPRRTLVYASWDGEEPGLLGSTEWAEAHANAELQAKAVLYRGPTGAAFSASAAAIRLQHLVNQVADGRGRSGNPGERGHALACAPDARRQPCRRESRGQGQRQAGGRRQGSADRGRWAQARTTARSWNTSASPRSTWVSAERMTTAACYHSRYDSFDHYVRFGDPTFEYGVALAKVAGHIVLRTADADVLPLRFGDFSQTLHRYVDQLHKLVEDPTRKATAQQHQLLDAHAYALDSDPTRPLLPPVRDSDVPAIALAPLDQATQRLQQSAQAFQAAYARQAAGGFALPAPRLRQLNRQMGRMEQALTDADGLPGRPWFKHFIYAPGMLTGYGVKTVPGVREAIEARRWDEADRYATITAGVLDRYRAQLDQMTNLLAPSR
ncbi:transferrin receptor-like dimerization domain-containing protein [Rhodanobacter lindaniclasticus]